MSIHAMWAPSSASRWLPCPGSISLGIKAGNPDQPNVASVRGTVIHEMADTIITVSRYGEHITPPEVRWDFAAIIGNPSAMTWSDICSDLSPYFGQRKIDNSMVHQCSYYVGAVKACLEDMTDDAEAETEFRATHSDELFGTADLVIMDRGAQQVTIGDLKTGAHYVGVEGNKQLLTYAGMVLKHLDWEPEQVELLIVQPEQKMSEDPHQVRRWVTTYAVVMEHMKACEEAMESTEIKAGDHCAYCPAEGICPVEHEVFGQVDEPAFFAGGI